MGRGSYFWFDQDGVEYDDADMAVGDWTPVKVGRESMTESEFESKVSGCDSAYRRGFKGALEYLGIEIVEDPVVTNIDLIAESLMKIVRGHGRVVSISNLRDAKVIAEYLDSDGMESDKNE